MLSKANKSILSRILVIILIQHLVFAAIAPTTTTTSSTASSLSSAFATPSFNFDFSSLTSQSSAQSAVNQAKTNWNDFFDSRTKPVFTDQLTNVIQGSDNQLRGTQN